MAVTSARWMMRPEAPAGWERPVLDFRQRLANEGVSILGLMIDTGDPLGGRPRGARWGARPARVSSAEVQDDAGEWAVIEQEFAAKVAAAWLCTPRAALGAVVQALRQEQRSRLAALQAKVAARQGAKTAEALAQHYRRLAEMVARGVPVLAERPSVEDVRRRIQAAIMRNRPG